MQRLYSCNVLPSISALPFQWLPALTVRFWLPDEPQGSTRTNVNPRLVNSVYWLGGFRVATKNSDTLLLKLVPRPIRKLEVHESGRRPIPGLAVTEWLCSLPGLLRALRSKFRKTLFHSRKSFKIQASLELTSTSINWKLKRVRFLWKKSGCSRGEEQLTPRGMSIWVCFSTQWSKLPAGKITYLGI